MLRLIVVFTIVALEGAAIGAPSAEELFDQGQTSFDGRDYASAVAKWDESYELLEGARAVVWTSPRRFDWMGGVLRRSRRIGVSSRRHQPRSGVPSPTTSSAS